MLPFKLEKPEDIDLTEQKNGLTKSVCMRADERIYISNSLLLHPSQILPVAPSY